MSELIINNDKLNHITQEIIKLAGECKIILFSYKLTVTGAPASFKLCVICNTQNKSELEKQIYILIDSPLPYDVVIYTFSEWQILKNNNNSFAAKIDKTGCVLHETKI